MGAIVVCGGGVVGLAVAVMLARDGHEVTVLEADPDGAPTTPEAAWAGWRRHGVAQFHQPHILLPRFREVLDRELPGYTDALLAAGCVSSSALGTLPPGITDRAPRPDDDRLRFVTGRRPVVESALAAGAERQPGVTVRRGTRVAGLLPGPAALPGVPHAAGVRTTAGERLPADLVVDATGRRTPAAGWLAGLGARPAEVSSQDRGFGYYTRYFTGPSRPPLTGPAVAAFGSFSLLSLYGDNGTWSLTIFTVGGDPPMKALRDPAVFTRVVAACRLQAHWLDGRPLTGVLPMAGVLDTRRRFVVDGRPVVTGFAAVGDSWACTNPSGGRGLSVGLAHAQLLRQVVAGHLGDPAGFAQAWDEVTERVVAPFFRAQLAADRQRIGGMRAAAAGREPPPPDRMDLFTAAAMHDAVLFRALLEASSCLAPPEEVLDRPEVQERLAAVGEAEPLRLPGPDRAQLLDLVAA